MNTVFILGAGASKQAGVPLMKEFLDVAETLWRENVVSDGKAHFKILFEALSKLQQVHSKARLDLENVEAVFAAFEMAKVLRRFADYSANDIDLLIEAMRSVMVTTIEHALNLPVDKQGRVRPPVPYADFAELIQHLRGSIPAPGRKVTVITFNYDMAVDYTFHAMGIPFGYGLHEAANKNNVALLKLHGSLNWARCRKCDKVVAWELSEYFRGREWSHRAFHEDVSVVHLHIGSRIQSFKHCQEPVVPEPVIAPPTWNKSYHYNALSPVWENAARELEAAENIVVVGYSLPESDMFFRYLYALGTAGDTRIKRFWVFDPEDRNKPGGVKERFENLLGQGAEQRFWYYDRTFEQAINILNKELA